MEKIRRWEKDEQKLYLLVGTNIFLRIKTYWLRIKNDLVFSLFHLAGFQIIIDLTKLLDKLSFRSFLLHELKVLGEH